MELATLWLLFAGVVGLVASSRGRTGFGWFVLALVFSPLLMFLLVVCLPNLKLQRESRARDEAAARDVDLERVKCPECAELVLREARKCKHCGATLTPQAVFAPARWSEPSLDRPSRMPVQQMGQPMPPLPPV